MSDAGVSELEARIAQLEAENAALRSEVDATTSTGGTDAGPPPARERRRWGRTAAAVVLVVVGLLLAPVAVISAWARLELVDTERFVATFAPLADDPAVQAYIADEVTAAIEDQVDIPGIDRRPLRRPRGSRPAAEGGDRARPARGACHPGAAVARLGHRRSGGRVGRVRRRVGDRAPGQPPAVRGGDPGRPRRGALDRRRRHDLGAARPDHRSREGSPPGSGRRLRVSHSPRSTAASSWHRTTRSCSCRPSTRSPLRRARGSRGSRSCSSSPACSWPSDARRRSCGRPGDSRSRC